MGLRLRHDSYREKKAELMKEIKIKLYSTSFHKEGKIEIAIAFGRWGNFFEMPVYKFCVSGW